MQVRKFNTYEEGEKYAEEHGLELRYFTLCNGQQDWEWKMGDLAYGPIDVGEYMKYDSPDEIMTFGSKKDFLDLLREDLEEDQRDYDLNDPDDVARKEEKMPYTIDEYIDKASAYIGELNPEKIIIRRGSLYGNFMEKNDPEWFIEITNKYEMTYFDDDVTTTVIGVEYIETEEDREASRLEKIRREKLDERFRKADKMAQEEFDRRYEELRKSDPEAWEGIDRLYRKLDEEGCHGDERRKINQKLSRKLKEHGLRLSANDFLKEVE